MDTWCYLIAVLIIISLVAIAEHLSMCLLTICISSSQKRLDTFIHFKIGLGLPWWLSGKASTCQCRRHGFSQSLIWEDSTCRGTARPGTTATEPVLWRPVSRLLKRSTLEPCSTARDATTERSSHVVTREEPLFVTTREKPAKQRRPSTVKNK